MTWYHTVESRIQDAMSAGVFDALPGAGQPLPNRPEDELAGANWVGNKILRDAGALPQWLMLAKEIETRQADLDKLEHRFRALVQIAAESGDWQHFASRINDLAARFAEDCRTLRSRQDQFNFDAPSIHLERPGIWVEARIERLKAHLHAAEAPAFIQAVA